MIKEIRTRLLWELLFSNLWKSLFFYYSDLVSIQYTTPDKSLDALWFNVFSFTVIAIKITTCTQVTVATKYMTQRNNIKILTTHDYLPNMTVAVIIKKYWARHPTSGDWSVHIIISDNLSHGFLTCISLAQLPLWIRCKGDGHYSGKVAEKKTHCILLLHYVLCGSGVTKGQGWSSRIRVQVVRLEW